MFPDEDYFGQVPIEPVDYFFEESNSLDNIQEIAGEQQQMIDTVIQQSKVFVSCIAAGEEQFNVSTQVYERLGKFLYIPESATCAELEKLKEFFIVGHEVSINAYEKLKFIKVEQILWEIGSQTVPALLVESLMIRPYTAPLPIIEKQVHNFACSREFFEIVSLPNWMMPLAPVLALIVSTDCKYWKNNPRIILALSEIASEPFASEPIVFFSKFLKAMIEGDLSLAEELWQYKPLNCITIPVFKITYFVFLISMPVSNENLAEALKRYRKVNYQTRNTKNNICYPLLKHLTAIAIDVLDPTITPRELKKEIFLKRMASIYDEFIPLMPILEQFERRMLSKILSDSE